MERDIVGLYDLIAAESRYASGQSEKLLGGVALMFATLLGLMFFVLWDLHLSYSGWLLLFPSFLIGFVGVVLYQHGSSEMSKATETVKKSEWYPKRSSP